MMMQGSLIRTALPALAVAAAALTAGHAAGREYGPRLRPVANPGAVIARELAFAQAAQEKGQWAAFAEFAAPDAVLFDPHMVLAQGWLKGRTNPPRSIRWQPVAVWSSCDGSLAVSHGAWEGGGPGANEHGWFTTIWQRQPDGTYRWVLDHGDTLAEPLAIPDMVPGRVADCPAAPAGEKAANPNETPRPNRKPQRPSAPFDPLARKGASRDGTLDWAVTITPTGTRHLVISWIEDGRRQTVRDETVRGETVHTDAVKEP